LNLRLYGEDADFSSQRQDPREKTQYKRPVLDL